MANCPTMSFVEIEYQNENKLSSTINLGGGTKLQQAGEFERQTWLGGADNSEGPATSPSTLVGQYFLHVNKSPVDTCCL